MNKILSTLGNYLTQRTTYTGICYLLGVYGFHISDAVQSQVADTGVLVVQTAFAIAGLINIIHNERSTNNK